MLTLLLIGIVALLLVGVLLGVVRTWQLAHSSSQALFSAGTAPNPPPDGLYKGTVPGHTVSWLGKKFDAGTATGVNLFKQADGSAREEYPFKTSSSNGVHDASLRVIAIDYDIPGNPLWLRPILDEVVETMPGQLLGKMQLRLIPGYPFTLTYFTLTKQ